MAIKIPTVTKLSIYAKAYDLGAVELIHPGSCYKYDYENKGDRTQRLWRCLCELKAFVTSDPDYLANKWSARITWQCRGREHLIMTVPLELVLKDFHVAISELLAKAEKLRTAGVTWQKVYDEFIDSLRKGST